MRAVVAGMEERRTDVTYLGDINQDLRALRLDAKPRCRFCLINEEQGHFYPNLATTSILNPAIGHPLPACQWCRDEWDEQQYHDWQAEQAYEREYGS